MNKRCGYFICCTGNTVDKYISRSVPKSLLDRAVCAVGFGGEYRLDRAKGFDRFVCKIAVSELTKKNLALPQINSSQIDLMAEKFLK